MQPIPSTAEILTYKMLNHSVDWDWVNWAVDMLMAGFDTESLVELAGISWFGNQFELAALTDKVFAELHLDYSDTNKVLKRHASYIIMQVIEGKRSLLNTLYLLKDLCCRLDYDTNLYDFYLLYFAKDDLLTQKDQSYWYGADRSNIDSIVMEYFTEWIKDNPIVF